VSVWRAIEPTTFVTREAFESVGAFRQDLGTGCATPWQSGEGTDLLLRMLSSGRRVMSQPDIWMRGDSSDDRMLPRALVRKHRGYARGTGFVHRIHRYPASTKARIVVAPWLRVRGLHSDYRMALRIAAARSLGRVEGVLGRTVGAPLSPW
jgi:hypothetical protein